MAYLKKNVNIALLLIIVAVLGGIALLSTYYQTTYKSLSGAYSAKLQELEQVSKNLSYQKGQLNQTYSELQLRTADKSRFESLYGNLTQTNEELAVDLDQTKSILADTTKRLDDALKQITAQQNTITTLQSKITEQKAEIQTLNNQICSLKTQLNQTC